MSMIVGYYVKGLLLALLALSALLFEPLVPT